MWSENLIITVVITIAALIWAIGALIYFYWRDHRREEHARKMKELDGRIREAHQDAERSFRENHCFYCPTCGKMMELVWADMVKGKKGTEKIRPSAGGVIKDEPKAAPQNRSVLA